MCSTCTCNFQKVNIQCIGIPKTIDNDLMLTDHTPGFGSAARYVATTMSEIALDSRVYDLPSVTIVEIMGRNTGWLTGAAAMAKRYTSGAPHLLYLPEIAFDPDAFLESIRRLQFTEQNVIVAVSEGICYADGKSVCAGDEIDAFGHLALSGTGSVLKQMVKEHIGCKVRTVELNILQRSAGHLCSDTDLEEARRVGTEAVSVLCRGETGVMIALKRVSEGPYLTTCEEVPVSEVANREKLVPTDWVLPDSTDITEQFYRYLTPLVREEIGTAQFGYFIFDE